MNTDKIYVTIVGSKYYNIHEPLPVGIQLMCRKEADNNYDDESIEVFAPNGRKVGCVANSVATKANGTMSAGRIYDKVGEYFLVRVCFAFQSSSICIVEDKNIEDTKLISDYMQEHASCND